jgi:hypothetical protein
MGTTPPKSTTGKPRSEETSKDTSGEISEPGPATMATEASGGPSATVTVPAERGAFRAALVAGGTALAACAGLVLFALLHTGHKDADPEHHTHTDPVTYEVTGEGTADITYQARSEAGMASVVKAAKLPWRKTVDVPLGKEPIVSIVLTEKGGQARCTLAIRGHHVQSATTSGMFGRATCTGALPTTPATATAS